MLRSRSGNGTASHGWSKASRMLLVMAVLLIAAAMAPAAAPAQQTACDAEVAATQDPAVASFSVDCDPDQLESVDVESSESGTIEENSGTACSPNGEGTSFTCEPTSSSPLISARFRASDEDVCDDPTLEITFSATTATGTDDTGSVEVANCSESGGEGSGDEGSAPEGGIDTGAGGTSSRHEAGGAPAAVWVLALGALVLAGGRLAARRRRAG
jgi:hypothetical protein